MENRNIHVRISYSQRNQKKANYIIVLLLPMMFMYWVVSKKKPLLVTFSLSDFYNNTDDGQVLPPLNKSNPNKPSSLLLPSTLSPNSMTQGDLAIPPVITASDASKKDAESSLIEI